MKTSRAMFRLRFRIRYHHGRIPRSALALVLLPVVLLAASTLNRAQATPPSSASSVEAAPGMRQYYLTQFRVYGDGALTACAAGYHFASIWEIADPSALKYNTSLGRTSADSGSGPPTQFPGLGPSIPARGWVRTGFSRSVSSYPGLANCDKWSSQDGADWGTVASLPSDWTGGTEDTGVWNGEAWACDGSMRVWCVEDDGVQHMFLPLVLSEAEGLVLGGY